MDEEITSNERNYTSQLTKLPKGKKIISVKWMYKTKLRKNSKIDKNC